MKIIGQTNTGYLVEASAGELLKLTGFTSVDEFAAGSNQQSCIHRPDSYNRHNWSFKIGTAFQVSDIFSWVQRLRERERQVLAGAEILSSLSEMLRAGVPSAIVPPPQDSGEAS